MESTRRTESAAQREVERRERIRKAQQMATDGKSNVLIARELGVAESTIRTLLKEKIS